MRSLQNPISPAKAGTQPNEKNDWAPAFAGVTG